MDVDSRCLLQSNLGKRVLQWSHVLMDVDRMKWKKQIWFRCLSFNGATS